MPRPQNPTLADLRRKMAIRLGFGNQGSALATQEPIFNEYLQDAQEQLFEFFSDMLLEDFVDDFQINEGQTLYDVPDHADPQRLGDFNVQISGFWQPLNHGIRMGHRDDYEGTPSRWEVRYGTSGEAQIEISPTPDNSYTAGFTFIRKLNRFTVNSDRVTLHPRLVLTLALANAAEHYGRPTAQRFTAQAQGLMGQMRARKNRGVDMRRGTSLKPLRDGVQDFVEKVNQITFERNALISEVGGNLIQE